MNPEWLCYVNGQEYGPYTWPQLVQMAATGNVVPSTHVRRNFDSQWYLAEQVPGLFAPAAAAPLSAASPKQAVHPSSPARTAVVAKAVAQPTYPQPTQPQQPVAVPKGRVVAAAPTAITPVADTRPQPIAVNAAVKTYASPAAQDDDEPIPGRKKDSTKQMVLYLGGAIVGVALLGGAALIWKFTRPPEVPQEVAVAPVVLPADESDPNLISEEANAAEANPNDLPGNANPANKTTTKATAKTVTPKQVEAATAVANPLIKSIAAWKPIEKFGSVGAKSGLTCTKLSAYLAADATGRKVAVRTTGTVVTPAAAEATDNAAAASITPAAAETPPIAAPVAPPAGPVKYVSAEAAPFLFVEMTITNRDSKPLTYGGCNSGETTALLIDAAGKPFSLVPVSGTPNVVRQPAGKEVKPGEAIQDTLVFEVPPTADLLFRFVLPRVAFSPKLPPGGWGYEISGPALAAAGNTQIAGGPAGSAAPTGPIGRQAIPIPGLQEPPPMPQPAPAPAQPAEPEMKKPVPMERIPIPGLGDAPETKPAGPKVPEEVPNLNPPAKNQ
jgi:hypothetical protein